MVNYARLLDSLPCESGRCGDLCGHFPVLNDDSGPEMQCEMASRQPDRNAISAWHTESVCRELLVTFHRPSDSNKAILCGRPVYWSAHRCRNSIFIPSWACRRGECRPSINTTVSCQYCQYLKCLIQRLLWIWGFLRTEINIFSGVIKVSPGWVAHRF